MMTSSFMNPRHIGLIPSPSGKPYLSIGARILIEVIEKKQYDIWMNERRPNGRPYKSIDDIPPFTDEQKAEVVAEWEAEVAKFERRYCSYGSYME